MSWAPAREHRSTQPSSSGPKAPTILKSLWRECRKKEAHKKGASFQAEAPAPLRVPDQKSCDAKEHQGRAQAFEREGDDPGGDDPQGKADHERAPAV
jgi:hypothetical protein